MSGFYPNGSNLPSDTRVRCDNCAWRGTLAEVRTVQDAGERLEVGGTVPAGECPQCGALAYLADDGQPKETPRSEASKALTTDMAKRGKTRPIEYYRLWPGNGGDSGTWDTDFVQIAADTPDDKIEEAVQQAVAKIKWRDQPPAITGIYSVPTPEEDEDLNS
jgi:hypothetical protein